MGQRKGEEYRFKDKVGGYEDCKNQPLERGFCQDGL